jgi:hypothetical protein
VQQGGAVDVSRKKAKRGCCHATIISCFPMKEDAEAKTKKKKGKKTLLGRTRRQVIDKQ